MKDHLTPEELRRYSCADCLVVWNREIARYQKEIAELKVRLEVLELARPEDIQTVYVEVEPPL